MLPHKETYYPEILFFNFVNKIPLSFYLKFMGGMGI